MGPNAIYIGSGGMTILPLDLLLTTMRIQSYFHSSII